MSSKFIEILDTKDSPLCMSASDVRLEDVLAHQEAIRKTDWTGKIVPRLSNVGND
ncbi:hypothetical protein FE257_003332 [Aspergillus nanangensis]|uniref:Uncharacterized protein n=1 Tax=Aspergillus nanangensis TaxID=2582783 RepID=A0AAD4CSV1_ASPNN|nr:hypothetical protein FE257_003332 [Aspergillus nanangensis]